MPNLVSGVVALVVGLYSLIITYISSEQNTVEYGNCYIILVNALINFIQFLCAKLGYKPIYIWNCVTTMVEAALQIVIMYLCYHDDLTPYDEVVVLFTIVVAIDALSDTLTDLLAGLAGDQDSTGVRIFHCLENILISVFAWTLWSKTLYYWKQDNYE